MFSPLPQAHVHGSNEGWSRAGGESYAGAPQPNPWRHVASAVVAPTSLPPSLFFNKFVVLIEVTPLLKLDMGDSWMIFLICYRLEDITSEIQQVQIWAIVCLPRFAMVGSSGLSISSLSCMTNWSKCGRSTSKILEVSKVLQERILHMRNGEAFLVSRFSTHSAASKREARWRGGDDFVQETVWLDTFIWRQDCSLVDQMSAVATCLLRISDN